MRSRPTKKVLAATLEEPVRRLLPAREGPLVRAVEVEYRH